jgi:hypothetical protein
MGDMSELLFGEGEKDRRRRKARRDKAIREAGPFRIPAFEPSGNGHKPKASATPLYVALVMKLKEEQKAKARRPETPLERTIRAAFVAALKGQSK